MLQVIRDPFGNPVGLSLLPVAHLSSASPKENEDPAFAFSPRRQTGLSRNRRNPAHQQTTAALRINNP